MRGSSKPNAAVLTVCDHPLIPRFSANPTKKLNHRNFSTCPLPHSTLNHEKAPSSLQFPLYISTSLASASCCRLFEPLQHLFYPVFPLTIVLLFKSFNNVHSLTSQAFNKAAFSPRRGRRGRTPMRSPNRLPAPAQPAGSVPVVRSNMSQITDASAAMSPSSSVGVSSPQKLLTSGSQSTVGPESTPRGARPASYRNSAELHTLDLQMYGGETLPDAVTPTGNGNGNVLSTPPKLVPSSFSTGDVPTLKQVSGSGVGMTPNHAAQQHLHNHNASMGRFPAGAAPRHGRELSTDARGHNAAAFQGLGSVLQGDSNAFVPNQGPMYTGAFGSASQAPAANGVTSNAQSVSPFGNVFNNGGAYPPNGGAFIPGGYNSTPQGYNAVNGGAYTPAGGAYPANGYNGNTGVALTSPGSLLQSMNGLSLNTNNAFPANGYASADYGNYPGMPTPTQPRDSQARVMQNRRQQDHEGENLPLTAIA